MRCLALSVELNWRVCEGSDQWIFRLLDSITRCMSKANYTMLYIMTDRPSSSILVIIVAKHTSQWTPRIHHAALNSTLSPLIFVLTEVYSKVVSCLPIWRIGLYYSYIVSVLPWLDLFEKDGILKQLIPKIRFLLHPNIYFIMRSWWRFLHPMDTPHWCIEGRTCNNPCLPRGQQ